MTKTEKDIKAKVITQEAYVPSRIVTNVLDQSSIEGYEINKTNIPRLPINIQIAAVTDLQQFFSFVEV